MLTFGISAGLKLRADISNQAFDIAKSIIDAWSKEKLNNIRSGSRNYVATDKTFQHGLQSVWQSNLSQRADFGGNWNTEVRVYREEPSAKALLLTIAMRLDFDEPKLQPARYYVEPPRFLLQLNDQFDVYVGDSQARAEVTEIASDRDVDTLVESLQSNERSLPLVIVTDHVNGEPVISGLTKDLAAKLFGLALVVHVNCDATFELTHQIGREMSCFNGAIRVFWPGWKRTDSVYKHPLLLASRVEASALADPQRPGAAIRTSLLAILTRACASRFANPQSIRSTIEEHERHDVEEEVLQRTQAEVVSRVIAAERQLVEQRGLAEMAVAENAELASQNESLKEQLWKLQIRNHQLLESTSRSGAGPLGTDQEDRDPWDIDDITEALELARKNFAVNLIIPESLQIQTSQKGGFWYHVLMSLHLLCDKERGGEASNKRAQLRQLLIDTVGVNKDTYKVGDTGVFVENPSTNARVEARERVHLKEGKPAETESVYWHTVGGKRSEYQYLIGRIGRHP